MHELSVCQTIVSTVEEIAQSRESAVQSITLQVGPLSGVEAQLLQNAYPLASAGTRSAGARLIIEPLPVRVSCRSCGKQATVPPNRLVCPACNDWHTDLLGGDELLLARVELSVADRPIVLANGSGAALE
jgi:hydrogenase nickel incorporation protein HypA/HybF